MTCVTVLGWWAARNEVEGQRVSRFMKEVDRTEQGIASRLNRYRLVLRAARSSLLAGKLVDGDHWRDFASGLSLRADCPGFPFLMFIEYLPGQERSRRGGPGGGRDSQYHPPWPPGQRDAYFVARFIAPAEGNGFLLGFDFGTDPSARACLEASRSSPGNCLSGRLKSIPHIEEATVLMALPVFQDPEPAGRQEFLGWVAAPLQVSSFMKDSLSGLAGEIEVEVFDEPAVSRETVLHDFDSILRAGAAPSPHGLSHTTVLNLGGRKWHLCFTTLPPFENSVDPTTPRLVIVCGVILTALFLSLLYRRRLIADRRHAEDLSTLKTQFLANMSHEVRTPLTAILGYLDLLEDPGEGPAAKKQHLEIIRRNGRHLLQIINDVLDISKIEAGRLSVQRIHCSTMAIIRDVTSLLSPRATEKGLEFEVAYESAIPETIHTDPTRLRQILLNLIGNAIKFTEKGRIVLSAKLIRGPDASQSLLSFNVTDTGVGLSQEDLAKLFRPFSQVDSSSTRRHGGAGLGLALSRRLAQLLGGDIAVQSRKGSGSTFSVTVETGPLVATKLLSDPVASKTTVEKEREEAAGLRLGGRVLLAEDSPEIQHLVALHIARSGAEVTCANNGQDACEAALAALSAGEPFDAILMDIQMPILDGLGATKLLRSSGYGSPIIALTANAMEGYREKCLEEGFNDFVAKPLDRLQLLKTLGKYLPEPTPAAPPPKRAQRVAPPVGQEAPQVLRSSLAGDPIMSELLPEFVVSLAKMLEEMDEALSSGDLALVRKYAHQIKGSGGSFGFPQISEAAAALESALKSDAPAEAIEEHLQRLSTLAGVISVS